MKVLDMRKQFALGLAFILCISTAACGQSSDSEADSSAGTGVSGEDTAAGEAAATEETPGTEEAAVPEEAPDVTGDYSFTESAMGGAFEVEWKLSLNADGTFVLAENGPMGEGEYTGNYTQEGAAVVTGPLEGGTPQADFFNEDQSCEWVLDLDARTAEPANYDPNAEAGLILDGTEGIDIGGFAMGGATGSGSENADFPAVSYASESSSQVMDIFLPENPAGASAVIIVVHGGGFKFGSQTMDIIQPVIETGVANGYVVASVDYRKSDEATFPGALSDVKAAVRYLKANAATYGIDTDRIVIWGESAGAYLSLMTALTPEVEQLDGDVADNSEQSSSVAALVDFYGPVEFYTMDEEYAALGISGTSYSEDSSFESQFLGQAIGLDKDATYEAYWETYTDSLPSDFSLSAWIQAGDADTNVPYTQSENFASRLAGVIGSDHVEFGLIEGAAHEDDAFYTEENLGEVFAFLGSVLN